MNMVIQASLLHVVLMTSNFAFEEKKNKALQEILNVIKRPIFWVIDNDHLSCDKDRELAA